MINPEHELFRWGPIPGRPLFTSHFMVAIAGPFPQTYGCRWPELVFSFKENSMIAICDYAELRGTGKRLFSTWMMDDARFAQLHEAYERAVDRLESIHVKINDLRKKSDQELSALYEQWQTAYVLFWVHGLVPEFANLGGEQLLKEALEQIVDGRAFLRVFERLSAPEQLSFYLEEALDLLRLKQREGTSKFKQLLTRHAKQYYWINNSYFETFVLDEAYFKKRLGELTSNQAEKEIEKIASLPQKIREEKAAVVQEFNPDAELQKIAQRLSYCVFWQDARKKQIFKTLHYLHLFIEEIGRRTSTPAEDLSFCWGAELGASIQGGGPPSEELAERKQQLVCHYTDRIELITGTRCRALMEPFSAKKVDPGAREVQGLPVSLGQGIVSGKAKVLFSPKQLDKMDEGDILIAPMTSPEFVLAMRKAAAIVTDEGGMTSHAAIVSRELGIPCVVGTKSATLVFHDGDLVEVDAEKGIVRKL